MIIGELNTGMCSEWRDRVAGERRGIVGAGSVWVCGRVVGSIEWLEQPGVQIGDHTMCRMSAQWGSFALGDMSRKGFGTVWGGCGDGGGRKRIWSGVTRRFVR